MTLGNGGRLKNGQEQLGLGRFTKREGTTKKEYAIADDLLFYPAGITFQGSPLSFLNRYRAVTRSVKWLNPFEDILLPSRLYLGW
jgi:hypothetical protein